MSDKRIKTLIADTFLEVADALETGQYGKKPVIGFASEGSEHGEDNIKRAMELASSPSILLFLPPVISSTRPTPYRGSLQASPPWNTARQGQVDSVFLC